MPSPAGDSPRSTRTRAKKACISCNARRVRCNVLETQPCRNCVAMNLPCELGVSRRGKYPRNKRQSDSFGVGGSASPATTVSSTNNSLAQDQHFESPSNPVTSPFSISQQNEGHGRVHSQESRMDDTPSYTPPFHQTVFLGESSPLTCVVDEGRRSPERGYAGSMQRIRLHYPISNDIDATTARSDSLLAHKKRINDRLHSEGAFAFPSPRICDTLLQAYFAWFHPCFPIIDRPTFQKQYTSREVSPLLLHAMLFIGVSLCSDVAFGTTGYENRYQAKFLFYDRAKEIYDADWESNATVKLQSLFLLSCWRGGPSEERDVRFWLGVAISLAQKKGMHVMSKLPFHDPVEQKVWKRIWWALYIRDQQSSTALGLPPRIRDEDCDVSLPIASDFQETDTLDSDIFGKPRLEHALYMIEMAKLARILPEIVLAQYSPGRMDRQVPSRVELRKRLTEWESNLPDEMKLQNATDQGTTFLVGMLHMTYNNLYILLYRPLFLRSTGEMLQNDGHLALEAASKSTRIIEDMLSQNLVQHGALHLITHIFSALCIHTIHFCRTTGTAKKLAEHRAKLCLVGLQELQKAWDLENWVLDLFFRCLDDSTARNLRLTDDAECLDRDRDAPRQPASSQQNITLNDHPTNGPNDTPLPAEMRVPQTQPGDISAQNEYHGLFNFSEDYTDVLGSLSEPDSLNLQNLEFLYRFL